jgi:hypothetical protein
MPRCLNTKPQRDYNQSCPHFTSSGVFSTGRQRIDPSNSPARLIMSERVEAQARRVAMYESVCVSHNSSHSLNPNQAGCVIANRGLEEKHIAMV